MKIENKKYFLKMTGIDDPVIMLVVTKSIWYINYLMWWYFLWSMCELFSIYFLLTSLNIHMPWYLVPWYLVTYNCQLWMLSPKTILNVISGSLKIFNLINIEINFVSYIYIRLTSEQLITWRHVICECHPKIDLIWLCTNWIGDILLINCLIVHS